MTGRPSVEGATVVLRSGDVVRIRPVRRSDLPALATAYGRLSEQSRYRRFMAGKPALPQSVLDKAVAVDHERHEALVALPPLTNEIVGEARFVRDPADPATADLAITVADEWQGRGLGSELLAQLAARADALGITYFTADVLAENKPMLGLLESLGTVEIERHGTTVSALVDMTNRPEAVRFDMTRTLRAAARGDLICLPEPLRTWLRTSAQIQRALLLPPVRQLAERL